ncbi:MAG: dephospho-CoA kinase [[Clostridium] spiroforme]|uniref:Dephospho-CoA kinase n=1 Tax=Thomasclavelia spiroformis TaxID=29348 RepID=A0A943ELV4_9FIRM|nr:MULTISPECIES: dephospho-CoA kinase [Thomasclavelia]MBS5588889.1 dephospho-CoA kinase [Thomasclavelia spiroformis]
MEVFGITGSIATGKSTVTNYLRDKGYLVVDSDKLAYDALTIDQDCINKTKTRFNLPKGAIDRKKLGKIIFNDKKAKADLEKIIHPYVISRIKEIIEDNRDLKYIFLDIPLLYESKLEYLCNKVIVVYLNLEDELKRLMKRDGIDEEYAKLIIANQMCIEEKKEKADIILDNSGSLENLYAQIEELLKGR